MKANEFLDDFGRYNAVYSRTYAEKRAQALRDVKLIPKGLRGPHAPDLEPVDMARLLIALAATTDADTVNTVLTGMSISAVGERWFKGADDFGAALVAIFEKYERLEQVREVVICRSWPTATIVTKNPQFPDDLSKDKSFTFSTLEPPPREKMVCRIDYRIGWQFFHDVHCSYVSGLGPKPSKAGWDRALKLHKIEQEQGPEAAEKWAKENPFVDSGEAE